MGTFFHSWRRKIGVLTLVLACVLMVGWVASLRAVLHTAFSIGKCTLIQLISREATVTIRKVHSKLPVQEIQVDRVLLMGFQTPQGRSTGNLAVNVDSKARADEGSPYHWTIKNYGFEIGGVVDAKFPLDVFIVTVPYWSIVLPLTLLSAWLLLSKRRQKVTSN